MKFDPRKRNLFQAKDSLVLSNLLPWIEDAQAFIENCTQCGECINCCPEKVIVQGDGGYPSINFNLGECSFCAKCADVCNEQVFVTTDQQAWLKKAQIKDSCLSYANVYCRSCSDSCERQAISFQLGLSATPQINLDLCNGCGACVSPCPTQSIIIKELE